MQTVFQSALGRRARAALGSLSLIGACGFSQASLAQAQAVIPDCAALGAWAVKLDRNAMWKPNDIGSRNEIPSLLASEDTAALFKKPMAAWTDGEVKAIRDAVLACRKNTKDKAESGAYNAMQSALISRVANFVNAAAQARPKAAAAVAALKAQPASQPLLRFQAALAEAVTLDGYTRAQRVAGGLPASAAAPGRDLLAAMRELPQAEIVETVAKPAAAAVEAMRPEVVRSLLADVENIPATGGGLATLDQIAQALPRDDGPALGDSLKTVQQAMGARRESVTEAITADLIKQIAASPPNLDTAFADIDQYADGAFLSRLSPAQAGRVRDAAGARRQAVAEPMFNQMHKALAALPATEPSLQQVDGMLGVINAWPASAAAFKPRFQEAAQARRAAIQSVIDKERK